MQPLSPLGNLPGSCLSSPLPHLYPGIPKYWHLGRLWLAGSGEGVVQGPGRLQLQTGQNGTLVTLRDPLGGAALKTILRSIHSSWETDWEWED